MSKIDVIDYCGGCSSIYLAQRQEYCNKTNKVVNANMHPPDWCPLEDANQPTVEVDVRESCLTIIQCDKRYEGCFDSCPSWQPPAT